MSLPVFGFVSVHQEPLADGVAAETQWAARVAQRGRAQAHLWCGRPGLVVPASYRRLPRFDDACAHAAAAGCPVQVRASGGGLVPQGAGLLNLSLLWRADRAAPSDTDAVYGGLCGQLAHALARLGIAAAAQPVLGSFCDGRHNLAVGGRKLVGTAQAWRRIGGVPVVLAHAVLIVDADVHALCGSANAFEAIAGSQRRYEEQALTSIAEVLGRRLHGPALTARVQQLLGAQLARVDLAAAA